MGFDIQEPSPLLKQAAIYGPEAVAQLLEYERIIRDVAETLATEAGLPWTYCPPSVPHHREAPPHALPPP
ncbi:hypothetical protein D3C59_35225 [Streptomyces sp. SHP22-7]|nr:hypothetical protein D3C59_35225 [Streptomyces sp. SHP22-7]